MHPDLRLPLRLAGLYGLFSCIWIIASDSLLRALVSDPDWFAQLQTVKGLSFVLISSLLIFYLGYRDYRAQRALLDALEQNARRLQQAQQIAALGSWEYREAFHWSPEALQLFGRDPGCAISSLEQLLGWLHPSDRAAVQRAMRALLLRGEALAVSARLHQPAQQQSRWLMLRGEADEDGSILGTVQDISQQRRDELALRTSNQRFRQLFEQIPRIAVQGYDRERRVIYWNQASAQLYGYSLQEAMGRRLEELIVPPPARRQVVGAINHWLLGGPAIPPAEIQLQRKDGSRVWVYSSHAMLRDSHDQPQLFCIDIDLSEQKQLDADLRASEASYRELLERLGEVIVACDASGHLTFVNPAWETLSGFAGYESLGRALPRFFEPGDGRRLNQQLATLAVQGQGVLRGEYRLRSRQGRLRWVDLQLGRQPDGDLCGSLREVHQQHQTQALLQARAALLEQVLAGRPLADILENLRLRLQALEPRLQVAIDLLEPPLHLPLEVGHTEPGSRPASGHRILPFSDEQGRPLGSLEICQDQADGPAADNGMTADFARLAGLAVSLSRNASARRMNREPDHQSPV